MRLVGRKDKKDNKKDKRKDKKDNKKDKRKNNRRKNNRRKNNRNNRRSCTKVLVIWCKAVQSKASQSAKLGKNKRRGKK